MTTLKDIVQARAALIGQDARREAEYAEWRKRFAAELSRLNEAEQLLAGGVDLDRLNAGLKVIYVRGDYRRVGGEAGTCVTDAKADLAARAPRLKQEYFGAKNYDRFYGQRSDCTYGMGPTHGYIVFSIGLTDSARKMTLTDGEIEAALYALANIDKVLDARAKGAAA